MKTRLASSPVDRRTPTRQDPRIALRRLRVAFFGLVANAKRKPDRFYSLTRDRECAYPFEREREFIHLAIHEGATTPEQVVEWRMTQLRDDLDQFEEAPQLEEIVYLNLIREQAEALSAQSLAHGNPTPANLDRAVRETEESIAVSKAFTVLARTGRRLLHLPH